MHGARWVPINECDSLVTIWSPLVFPDLRGVLRENGVIDGPQTGPVVPWIRSREREGPLAAGPIAVSTDTATSAEVLACVSDVAGRFTRVTRNRLFAGGFVGGLTVHAGALCGFRVGKPARRRVISGI